jgi:hypothetical protein
MPSAAKVKFENAKPRRLAKMDLFIVISLSHASPHAIFIELGNPRKK